LSRNFSATRRLRRPLWPVQAFVFVAHHATSHPVATGITGGL